MRRSNEIREEFLNFFKQRGHEVVPSSPLVPANDPTLLFTNAGMVQFKDVFLGREQRGYSRATSSQRCLRAGGKHNDLENVGYTARHHTFFEMLGNFSFGDYFKRDAITYAWEFVTEVAGLPDDKLWVTVFDKDEEAEKIWLDEIGVPADRVKRVSESDNFWAMGDIGPCGPCTEIFYDHGEGLDGASPGSRGPEGDRYVEIWNLVFMQYERGQGGSMTPLPEPSVDTGMGLERMAAVMQGRHSNYDTDLFRGLIERVAEIAECDSDRSPSLKVIADHIRACGFLVADGVRPENEGRGYVLRRIIRRAARHGHRLGIREPFFHLLIEPLRKLMGDAYPELYATAIPEVLKKEEERFSATLEAGLRILEDGLARATSKTIPGEVVFKLYDTYGFPVDLTADIARERSLGLDIPGFEVLMKQQQERARGAHRFAMQADSAPAAACEGRFSGYDTTGKPAEVSQIFVNGEAVSKAGEGTDAVVVLDDTPFYAESGGQVGDTGMLNCAGGGFRVTDTQKQGGAHGHIGVIVRGRVAVGDRVDAQVDAARRRRIVLNHSATHLLHAALKRVLGSHVNQRGSLVAEDHLRFDFSHDSRVGADELHAIEDMVNDQIRGNIEAVAEVMPRKDADECGAVALFGEKYGDEVRVLTMGDFSVELCGGTHVARTGDIGTFKITAETGISAGVRRIEALTGEAAYRYLSAAADRVSEICALLQADEGDLGARVWQLSEDNKQLKKQLAAHRSQQVYEAGRKLKEQVKKVNGVQILATRVNGGDRHSLRTVLDGLKSELDRAAIVLASVEGGKVRLIAGVTRELSGQVNASELVNFVAGQVGGRGGGRPDMAEAGGDNPAMLEVALDGVPDWVRLRIDRTLD